ncbi:hypothetical protein AAV94_10250 [Lampropedia cohaerens]|uniref:PepSY domain-containing protein n=1 Tax=Lampropedia cohaerens TaxID=1610491 RepID=A0A0U1PYD1_9BURK|nr:PepSY domain-containing protein [Lampropedia cohaerens]KKW67529.1 hypothetical protein AAV94_10250 [Lampropedia cohaerens]
MAIHQLPHITVRTCMPALAAALAFGTTAAIADSSREIQQQLATAKLSLSDAIERGLQEVPGQVIDIAIDQDDGTLLYEMEVVTSEGDSVELDIHAADGSVRKYENDGKASRRDQERLAAARLDIRQAIDAAVQHTPGTPYSAELDRHFGTVVYEVDILQDDARKFEVKIDAKTGAIVQAHED